MPKPQKKLQAKIFIDYIPAELRENKTWEIVYYVKNPFTQKLERVRNRVKPLRSITARKKLAKSMIKNINDKLESGWNKFIEESKTKSFEKITDVLNVYLRNIEKQIEKNILRVDTLRAYTSYVKNFKMFLKSRKQESMFVFDFKENIIEDFLDEIFYVRNNSARTHNNYLSFLHTFSNWLIKRKYINVNPTININKVKEGTKIRTTISAKDREIIFDYLKEHDYNYFVLCYTAFYTLLRRTELTKILVSDVYLKNKIINIREEVSKNNKEQVITIPNTLIHILVEHLSNAKNSDYLFSADNFKAGNKQLKPKKISDEWAQE